MNILFGTIQKRILVSVMAITMLFGMAAFAPKAEAQIANTSANDRLAALQMQIDQLSQIVTQLIAMIDARSAGGGAVGENSTEGGFMSRAIGISDTVQTTDSLKVRSSASAQSALRGVQRPFAQGEVVAGPRYSDGYTWWQIRYNNGQIGWSAENWLRQIKAGQQPDADDGETETDYQQDVKKVVDTLNNIWNVNDVTQSSVAEDITDLREEWEEMNEWYEDVEAEAESYGVKNDILDLLDEAEDAIEDADYKRGREELELANKYVDEAEELLDELDDLLDDVEDGRLDKVDNDQNNALQAMIDDLVEQVANMGGEANEPSDAERDEMNKTELENETDRLLDLIAELQEDSSEDYLAVKSSRNDPDNLHIVLSSSKQTDAMPFVFVLDASTSDVDVTIDKLTIMAEFDGDDVLIEEAGLIAPGHSPREFEFELIKGDGTGEYEIMFDLNNKLRIEAGEEQQLILTVAFEAVDEAIDATVEFTAWGGDIDANIEDQGTAHSEEHSISFGAADGSVDGFWTLGSDDFAYIVGVYEGSYPDGDTHRYGYHPQGEVTLNMNKQAGQSLDTMLVLTAYEPVLWKLQGDATSYVTRVFLSGYYDQEITGIDEDVEIIHLSNESDDQDYFYFYDKDSQQADELIDHIETKTGQNHYPYYGTYSADAITLGQKG